jgi:hypothetical protein
MDSELLQLQQRAYQAATEFAQAQSDYWAIHNPLVRNQQMMAAARECLKVGERYSVALKTLLQHLEMLAADGKQEQEINRTKRLMDSLKAEVEFFSVG